MITGKEMFVGTDIVEVERIKRAISHWKHYFLNRVFTAREVSKINAETPDYQRAAGLWAAKGSMVKAIGLGFRNGISFQDMEVEYDEYGCPYFILRGRLKEIVAEKGKAKISLSISHCQNYAIAVVAVTHD